MTELCKAIEMMRLVMKEERGRREIFEERNKTQEENIAKMELRNTEQHTN